VPVGTVIGVILEGDETKPANAPTAGAPAAATAEPAGAAVAQSGRAPEGAVPAPSGNGDASASGALRASPAGRAMARRLGVELSSVRGTGPRGRIQPEDIEATHRAAQAATANGASAAPAAAVPPPPPAPGPAQGPAELRRYRPTGVRAAMARQMARTLDVPQFCLFADIPFVGLERTRKRLAQQTGSRIGVTDILVRAVAVALAEHPALNAHWLDGEIVEYRAINIGIAADTPAGLIVPVLAGAERLGIADVAARSAALIASARASMLRPEDVSGATFTISNLGMLGVSTFQAVVNPPQVAILSAGAGRGDAGRTTTLGLSADHRAVDGAQGARFLQTLRDVIETADAGVLAGG
jgi:pyruvate dehydrogenase E2 component (dihydrolipoamide acetyltransferase)